MPKLQVEVNGRRFIVDMEGDQPQIIYERKVYQEGRPWERFFDQSYWHHKHHKVPTRKNTIFHKIMEQVKEKQSESSIEKSQV